jgi:hypothetical protein
MKLLIALCVKLRDKFVKLERLDAVPNPTINITSFSVHLADIPSPSTQKTTTSTTAAPINLSLEKGNNLTRPNIPPTLFFFKVDTSKQRSRPKEPAPDLGTNEIFDPETTKERGKCARHARIYVCFSFSFPPFHLALCGFYLLVNASWSVRGTCKRTGHHANLISIFHTDLRLRSNPSETSQDHNIHDSFFFSSAMGLWARWLWLVAVVIIFT